MSRLCFQKSADEHTAVRINGRRNRHCTIAQVGIVHVQNEARTRTANARLQRSRELWPIVHPHHVPSLQERSDRAENPAKKTPPQWPGEVAFDPPRIARVV